MKWKWVWHWHWHWQRGLHDLGSETKDSQHVKNSCQDWHLRLEMQRALHPQVHISLLLCIQGPCYSLGQDPGTISWDSRVTQANVSTWTSCPQSTSCTISVCCRAACVKQSQGNLLTLFMKPLYLQDQSPDDHLMLLHLLLPLPDLYTCCSHCLVPTHTLKT